MKLVSLGGCIHIRDGNKFVKLRGRNLIQAISNVADSEIRDILQKQPDRKNKLQTFRILKE